MKLIKQVITAPDGSKTEKLVAISEHFNSSDKDNKDKRVERKRRRSSSSKTQKYKEYRELAEEVVKKYGYKSLKDFRMHMIEIAPEDKEKVMMRMLLQERIEKSNSNDGCWLWKGVIDHDGYPIFHFQSARMLSYKSFKSVIPEGLTVHSKCNNKLCINPQHLYVGKE